MQLVEREERTASPPLRYTARKNSGPKQHDPWYLAKATSAVWPMQEPYSISSTPSRGCRARSSLHFESGAVLSLSSGEQGGQNGGGTK